jgi:Protein of unknown function (DUF1592)/Protein of unknown function (DUF1588)/Protein of unknown function (DUF1587)/Protein of unknown function (DUF1595)/Protein of unknown function (DUF1585)
MFLRRLTNQEYAATVHDLLGVEPAVDGLPPDLTLHGFDNNAESISISTAHLEGYRALAETLASELVASATRRDATVGCDPGSAEGATCLESFVRRFGLRAFRRPLTDEEASALIALSRTAPAAKGPWDQVGIVVEALLQAPSFLFRVEVGQPDPAHPDRVRLTGHEVATRLSYLVWGTMPDDRLFEAATSGGLDSAEGVEAQAIRMLEDGARARATVWSFARQWLRVGNLDGVDRPAEEFPIWSEALRAAEAEETRRVVDDYTSREGVPLLDLVDTPSTFVDSTLAKFYGVPSPANGTWAPATLPVAQGRLGILTHASILTLTANTAGTTPIRRGKYIRQVMLCDELPPPPPDVPTLPAARPGLGERERLAEHRTNPACGGCHSMLEPLGFGLSRFDAIGAYRERDGAGLPIDATGVIDGLPDATFDGALELVQRLRREPRVGACVSTHLVRFALGRVETESDTCTIGRLGDVLQKGGDFRALVRALVGSESFRYRLLADANQGARP